MKDLLVQKVAEAIYQSCDRRVDWDSAPPHMRLQFERTAREYIAAVAMIDEVADSAVKPKSKAQTKSGE